LFKKNPAIRRIAKKSQVIDDDGNDVGAGSSTIPESQYPPVIDRPQFLPNGWSPLLTETNPEISAAVAQYPFRVKRTGNKPQNSVGFLPVYSEFRYVVSSWFFGDLGCWPIFTFSVLCISSFCCLFQLVFAGRMVHV
jgi:hypothetical protein